MRYLDSFTDSDYLIGSDLCVCLALFANSLKLERECYEVAKRRRHGHRTLWESVVDNKSPAKGKCYYYLICPRFHKLRDALLGDHEKWVGKKKLLLCNLPHWRSPKKSRFKDWNKHKSIGNSNRSIDKYILMGSIVVFVRKKQRQWKPNILYNL